MRARVIGIGQASAGDDGVGLAVLDALRRESLPSGVELVRVAEPTALIPLFDGGTPMILVDAVVGAGEPGDLLSLPLDALDDKGPRLLSTHGVGVAPAVALARTLSPEAKATNVWIVAICIERPDALRNGLSPAIAAAVPRAVLAVLARVEGA
jgi:hydrogenase maturation protease